MLYKPLDEKRDEIRLLKFLEPLNSKTEEKLINLKLVHVALSRRTKEYQQHLRIQSQSDHETTSWRDKYTVSVDQHRLYHKDSSEELPAQSRADIGKSRHVWGDFEAVSYAWGEEDTSKRVVLDGVSMPISKTLHSALGHLYALPETQLGMYYWIDALCINQTDIIERNHQVKRIKRIYGLSRAVIVWLGVADPGMESVIRTMQKTYRDPAQNNRLFPPFAFSRDDWDALCAFLKNPYWRRVWIIQELAVNHHSTLFMCGKWRLSRAMLKTGADCCQKLLKEDDRFYQSRRSDVWLNATRLYRLVDLSADRPSHSISNTALSLARQAEARDPRDKVFGILGLLDQSISSKIDPDYTKSPQQIHEELTVAIIRGTKRLEQIIYKSKVLDTGWPSWVPDLRRPFPRQHVKSLSRRRASKKSQAVFDIKRQVDSGELLLTCKGYKVGIIDGMSASSRHSEPTMSGYNKMHIYGARTIHRSLVLDHFRTRRHPSLKKIPWVQPQTSRKRNYSGSLSVWNEILSNKDFREFHRFRQINENFRIGNHDFRDFFDQTPGNNIRAEVAKYHLRLAVHSLRGRKLATTRSGYIAMVPEDAQKDDLIVVLLGCNFPVLLRPHGLNFSVVGECYVHGIMDGRILDDARFDGTDPEYITIA